MKASKLIAAATVFAIAGSAFAADAPAAASAATAAAASIAAANSTAAKNLNVPAVVIGQPAAGADRATVRAEAAEAVKNHKTMLAVQLEQYKN